MSFFAWWAVASCKKRFFRRFRVTGQRTDVLQDEKRKNARKTGIIFKNTFERHYILVNLTSKTARFGFFSASQLESEKRK